MYVMRRYRNGRCIVLWQLFEAVCAATLFRRGRRVRKTLKSIFRSLTPVYAVPFSNRSATARFQSRPLEINHHVKLLNPKLRPTVKSPKFKDKLPPVQSNNAILDHVTRPSVESDHAHPSEMYSSNNRLNRRPRGMSLHNHSASRDNASILPKFLRRLSARTPDSYDRAEKMMNGGSGPYGNGNGHRNMPSFVGVMTGPRGRMFKVFGVIVFLLTALYLFLPWSPSFSSLGMFVAEFPHGRYQIFTFVVYQCLLETS